MTILNVRISADEMAGLKGDADALGVSLSEHVRGLLPLVDEPTPVLGRWVTFGEDYSHEYDVKIHTSEIEALREVNAQAQSSITRIAIFLPYGAVLHDVVRGNTD